MDISHDGAELRSRKAEKKCYLLLSLIHSTNINCARSWDAVVKQSQDVCLSATHSPSGKLDLFHLCQWKAEERKVIIAGRPMAICDLFQSNLTIRLGILQC